MHTFSHSAMILIHVNCGVRLCAVYSMRCGVQHSNSCSVLQFAAELRIAVSGSVAVRAAVCGCPVVLAAVCGCPAVRQCVAVWQCAYFQINWDQMCAAVSGRPAVRAAVCGCPAVRQCALSATVSIFQINSEWICFNSYEFGINQIILN
jgi:hypothetical protein